MKKLLIGAFALLFGLSAFAQNRGGDLSPEERADKLTEKMKSQLELTDAQVQQVKPLNLKMTTDMAAVNKQDPKAEALMKQIKDEYQKGLKKVLTPEQFEKAQEMNQQRRKMRQKKSNW